MTNAVHLRYHQDTWYIWYTLFNLEAAQMNVQHSLIQELILYKFKLSHNFAKTTKNICCANNEDAVEHSTVSRCSRNFAQVSRTSMIRHGQVGLKP